MGTTPWLGVLLLLIPETYTRIKKSINVSHVSENGIPFISEPLAPTAPSSRAVAPKAFRKTEHIGIKATLLIGFLL